uniref:Chromatin modification-related protein EAF6 n=1 Tax=Peronospora matthiolae TaxID=2874970 RepID=A0AAV1VH33_9STRA
MDAARGVLSDEMRTLYEAQRRAHETVLALQAQIEDEEAVYLDETPHGNIVRGWDGFLDSKQPRKDANVRKTRSYTESEHLFSSSCLYTSIAREPSLDQVTDIYGTSKDESGPLRKLTVTLSMGKGTGVSGSISGVVGSSFGGAVNRTATGERSHVDLLMQEKPVEAVAVVAREKGAATAAAALGLQPSQVAEVKKRKREAEVEALGLDAPAAAAVVLRGIQETASSAVAATSAASTGSAVMAHPPASDFLDVL